MLCNLLLEFSPSKEVSIDFLFLDFAQSSLELTQILFIVVDIEICGLGLKSISELFDCIGVGVCK